MPYKIISLREIDSTNAEALRNFGSFQDGTVICAEKQTAGRGRMDRKWLSEGKGIYFTIILKNAESAAIYAAFSQLMSVSVCRALQEYGFMPQIKLPNDVLCSADGNGTAGKICGILSQAASGQGGICGIALGVGINHSQENGDFVGVMYPAVSVQMLAGQKKDIAVPGKEEILDSVLDYFFRQKEIFEKKGFASIMEEYVHFCGFLGREIKISVNGGKETVFAKKINSDGTLTVVCGGTEKNIAAADILA